MDTLGCCCLTYWTRTSWLVCAVLYWHSCRPPLNWALRNVFQNEAGKMKQKLQIFMPCRGSPLLRDFSRDCWLSVPAYTIMETVFQDRLCIEIPSLESKPSKTGQKLTHLAFPFVVIKLMVCISLKKINGLWKSRLGPLDHRTEQDFLH